MIQCWKAKRKGTQTYNGKKNYKIITKLMINRSFSDTHFINFNKIHIKFKKKNAV